MARPKPILHCFVAIVDLRGNVWGKVEVRRLETVAYMKERGMAYAVVGPDPDDEIELATWEREQVPVRKTP